MQYLHGVQVLRQVAGNGELVNVALNTHGTRAVQKLIETLTSREQASWGCVEFCWGSRCSWVQESAAGGCSHGTFRLPAPRLWQSFGCLLRTCG